MLFERLKPRFGGLMLTQPAFLLAGSMADSPREGKVARPPDFTQLIDLASEFVGGKVSRVSQGENKCCI